MEDAMGIRSDDDDDDCDERCLGVRGIRIRGGKEEDLIITNRCVYNIYIWEA